ncbi:hypothetical protein OIU85_024247 [Salix viminalis]|uniref:Uncharacterized protein n=1 Tax=Salix viminalis TaxID=40686 RepID=A0A9Q0U0C7_SALVM|nr:hypothetical protein OIU85_024247 [Salix viminalis]
MESTNFITPPFNSFWIEKVRKVNSSRPNLSQVGLTLILDKHVIDNASLECEELWTRIVIGVEGKVLVAIHVIIVIPDDVKRDLSLFVVLYNIFNHRQVMVTPSTLVEPC